MLTLQTHYSNHEVGSTPSEKIHTKLNFQQIKYQKIKLKRNNYTKELKKIKRMRTKFEIKIIMRGQSRILN
jgi:hypothetical protein